MKKVFYLFDRVFHDMTMESEYQTFICYEKAIDAYNAKRICNDLYQTGAFIEYAELGKYPSAMYIKG